MGSKLRKVLKKLKKAKKNDKKGKLKNIRFTRSKKKFIRNAIAGDRNEPRYLYLPKSKGDKDKDSSRSESSSSSSSSPSYRSGGGGGGESSGQRTTGPSNEQGFSFYEGTEGMTPAEFDLYKDIKLRGIDSQNANKLQNIINKGKLEVAVIQRDASIYGSLVSGFW